MARSLTAFPSFALILADAAAWFIFGAGLVAPLTPSEGMPRLVDLLAFVALPLGLLALVATYAHARFAKIGALVQAAVLLTISAYLLGLQARLW